MSLIDPRVRLGALVLLALLGGTQTARAALRDGQLGAPCSNTTECAAGLDCWAADALESSVDGPAGGFCTEPCPTGPCPVSNGVCILDPRGAYCAEPCQYNLSFGGDFDPQKCHGRADVVCTHAALGAIGCIPRCGAGEPCPAGFTCNPRSGLCTSSPVEGEPFGNPCDPAADPCRGKCRRYADAVETSSGEGGDGASAPRALGVCEEECVIGGLGGCALPDAENGGACLLPWIGSGFGDLGLCVRLCNCSSDCPEIMVCEPWDFGGRFDAAGACVLGPRAPGARDCPSASGGASAEAECVYGTQRACRTTDGCLGIAECLADETYAECRCTADRGGEGGAPGSGGTEGGRDGGAPGGDASGAAGTRPGTGGESGQAGAGGVPDVSRGGVPALEPQGGSGCGCRLTPTSERPAWAILTLCIALASLRRARRDGARRARMFASRV